MSILQYCLEKIDLFKLSPFLLIDSKKKESSKINKFLSIIIIIITLYKTYVTLYYHFLL